MSSRIGWRTALVALAVVLSTVVVSMIALAVGDEQPASGDRFLVGELVVTLDGATVTLSGAVPSAEVAVALVDAVADRRDVVAVIDQLEIEPSAPWPALATVHTGLDALATRPG